MNATLLDFTLENINEDQIGRFVAPIVFLCILLVVGVPGNLTVLIIYWNKYTKSVYRSLILNLAIVDLIFCTIGIPFNIGRIVHYYTFKGQWVCKTFTAVLIFGIMYSTHLVMLLSLHRFRQICFPLKNQISLQNVHYFISACVIIGFILSWPQAVLIEIEHVTLERNITGHTCPVTASEPSVYSIAYSIFNVCMFFVYTIILFVLYSLIGKKAYQQRQKRLPVYTTERGRNVQLIDKMTKIAFTISVVFALSYLPLFVLKLAKDWFHEKDLNEIEFSILRIAERCYIINHVANPFIYALFDNRFRQNVRLLASFKWRFPKNEPQEQSKPDNEQTIPTTVPIYS
ncbi:unnamed protein product [Mytilus coruscus]|uniref:G-protein coupled receptors family 1 profile domain-containing protein n=1 Tax=Mytilus coruscus TaxID=42192 RepID=A0A6J8AM16_MYTCO|nr:unnamed protein product [Mytilus coruscus]